MGDDDSWPCNDCGETLTEELLDESGLRCPNCGANYDPENWDE